MTDKLYRIFVPAKGLMLPPVELSSTSDQDEVLALVESAIRQGYYQFSVIFA